MSKEQIYYDADQEARNSAFRIVRNPSTGGYNKACKAYDYIRGAKSDLSGFTPKQREKAFEARKRYITATA